MPHSRHLNRHNGLCLKCSRDILADAATMQGTGSTIMDTQANFLKSGVGFAVTYVSEGKVPIIVL